MSESDKTAELSYYSSCNVEAYALELANAAELTQICDRLLAYHQSGFSQELLFRTRALKRLKSWLKSHETEILEALHEDLKAPTRNAFISELVPVYRNLNLTLANMKSWSRPQSATKIPLPFTSKTIIHQSPLGLVSIVGSHTEPLQNCLIPLIQAISAGNCILLCPHEANPATARTLRRLCQESFDSRYIFCLPASKTAKDLAVKSEAGKIFFYGNAEEGAKVLHAAADNLTPVKLTLDAACPCVIDTDANIERLASAVSRKTLQGPKATHAAPSHFLVHESKLEDFKSRYKGKLPKASIVKWKEEDRYHLPRMIEDLGRIRVCYLFSNDEELRKRLAQLLSCDLLLTNDYSSLIASAQWIIPGKHANNASYLQGSLGFKEFSQSKISLKKSNLLELPLRIAKHAKTRALCSLAHRSDKTEQK